MRNWCTIMSITLRVATRSIATLVTAILALSAAAGAEGEPTAGASEADALAKQLSNPVASLISVPFQGNWEDGVGPEEDTRFVLNFQPVMPFSVNQDWNLIARVIVPFVDQPVLVPGGESTSGIGDILASFFLSPAQPKGFVWGAGPVLLLPVSSDPSLGSEQWGAGPTFLVLKQAGPWTLGALANHVWSFAGESDRPNVNQTFLQPFAAYGVKGWTFTLNSESTANWQAASTNTWTVPINLVVSKILKLGHRPLSVGVGGGYYVQEPEGGPEWKIRMALTLLFPAK